MSALGQKQTCAVQNGMSALPPIADIVARHYSTCGSSTFSMSVGSSLGVRELFTRRDTVQVCK